MIKKLTYGFTFQPLRDSSGNIIHGGTNKIGDRLIFSGLPQMIYEQTGEKVVDLDTNNWFWDNNPYVKRNVDHKNTVALQMIADRSTFHTYLRNQPNFLSIPDKYCCYFGLECTLRHPRLYKYENIEREPDKIILTTQGALQGHMMGESADRVLSDEVISQISQNYKNYKIVQIGSLSDKKAEGVNIIDRRGLPIWESVKEIASANMYIGVNCGVMWIAACYPHISLKVVLMEYSKESLKYFIPMNTDNHHSQWHDWSISWFNKLNEDVGITTSFKQI